MSVRDYNIMSSIRIDAPQSLINEFSRLDFKIKKPNDFETPIKTKNLINNNDDTYYPYKNI